MPAKKLTVAAIRGLDVEAAQTNPHMFLEDILSVANTQEQRAATLIDLLIRLKETSEYVAEAMALAWDTTIKEKIPKWTEPP